MQWLGFWFVDSIYLNGLMSSGHRISPSAERSRATHPKTTVGALATVNFIIIIYVRPLTCAKSLSGTDAVHFRSQINRLDFMIRSL